MLSAWAGDRPGWQQPAQQAQGDGQGEDQGADGRVEEGGAGQGPVALGRVEALEELGEHGVAEEPEGQEAEPDRRAIGAPAAGPGHELGMLGEHAPERPGPAPQVGGHHHHGRDHHAQHEHALQHVGPGHRLEPAAQGVGQDHQGDQPGPGPQGQAEELGHHPPPGQGLQGQVGHGEDHHHQGEQGGQGPGAVDAVAPGRPG